MHGGYAARAEAARVGLAHGVQSRVIAGPGEATRPGCGQDLPHPRNPRNLLLVRPTGKRRGREPHPPQAENHLHSISSSEQIADTLLSDLELPTGTAVNLTATPERIN